MSEEIQHILNKKDYYDILGIQKTATEEEMKKAYRKLALKFHPDKNKHHQSQEAFKKVAQAYDCLSNPDKRRVYDQYGTEKPEARQTYYEHNGQQEYYYTDDFAQNIFDAFFGAGAYRRPQQAHRQQQVNFNLFQFLPILILILISSSGFLQLFQKAPLYQFQRTYEYQTSKVTKTLEVRYFVRQDFKDEITSEKQLRELELEIESQYVQQLKQECNNIQYKRQMYESYARRAFYQRDRDQYLNYIRRLDYSSCESLNDYRSRFPRFDIIY